MHPSFEYMTNLQYEVRRSKKLVEAFESGERYIRLEKEYQRSLNQLKRENRHLKEELAAAHAEIVDVRNKVSR